MSSERVAWFILTQLNRKFGNQWLGGPTQGLTSSGTSARGGGSERAVNFDGGLLDEIRRREIRMSRTAENKLSQLQGLNQIFENYYLRSVREDSQRALVAWMRNQYPLDLIDYIPEPLSMLEAQCQGRRFVSLLDNPTDWDRPIGRHQGSLAFLLHDLEHADKFWGDPISHQGQRKFFRKLRDTLNAFTPLRQDPVFAKEFDYVLSDMNSHPLHLFKYLKAIVLMFFLRREGLEPNASLSQPAQDELDHFWRELMASWEFSEHEIDSGLRMNRPGLEQPEDGAIVTDFFLNPKEEV